MARKSKAPLDNLNRLKRKENTLLLQTQKVQREFRQANRKLEMRAKHLLGDWILEVHLDVLAQCVDAYQRHGREDDANVLVSWRESARARKKTSASGGGGSGKTDAGGAKLMNWPEASPIHSSIQLWRNSQKTINGPK